MNHLIIIDSISAGSDNEDNTAESGDEKNIAPFIFDEKRARTMLRYGSYDFELNVASKSFAGPSYWRCSWAHNGCSAKITAHYVDGCMKVNKSKDEIVHNNHTYTSPELDYTVYAQFITIKNVTYLVHNHYLFRKCQVHSDRTYWRCRYYKRLKCKATIVTKLVDGVVMAKCINDQHPHLPEYSLDQEDFETSLWRPISQKTT